MNVFRNLPKIITGCDVTSLNLPENGKAWKYNADKKRWELECDVNYEIERGQFLPKDLSIYKFEET